MKSITTATDGQIVINTALGDVTFDELAEYLEKNFESWIGKPVIWEVGKMTFRDISSEELRRFVTKMKPLSKKKKGEKAALVSAEGLPYGMMRMFEVFAESSSLGIQFKTFTSIGEAKIWILGDKK